MQGNITQVSYNQYMILLKISAMGKYISIKSIFKRQLHIFHCLFFSFQQELVFAQEIHFSALCLELIVAGVIMTALRPYVAVISDVAQVVDSHQVILILINNNISYSSGPSFLLKQRSWGLKIGYLNININLVDLILC